MLANAESEREDLTRRFSKKWSASFKQRIIVMVKESLSLPLQLDRTRAAVREKVGKILHFIHCVVHEELPHDKQAVAFLYPVSKLYARNAWCHDTPFSEQNGLHFRPQAFLCEDGTGPVYSWNDRRI